MSFVILIVDFASRYETRQTIRIMSSKTFVTPDHTDIRNVITRFARLRHGPVGSSRVYGITQEERNAPWMGKLLARLQYNFLLQRHKTRERDPPQLLFACRRNDCEAFLCIIPDMVLPYVRCRNAVVTFRNIPSLRFCPSIWKLGVLCNGREWS